nr:hypothetical protein [Streptomyces sp. alain-838]
METLNADRPPQRNSLRHIRTAAVLASAGMLVSIVLSALPQEPPPPVPFTAGYHEDRPSAVSTGTGEAAAVFRLIRSAGLPVDHAVLYVSRDDDPDGLLGRPGGYRSKLAFEDCRIDDGTLSRIGPGSVQLGGVVEVFPDPEAARTRAQNLHAPMASLPGGGVRLPQRADFAAALVVPDRERGR